ncbi:MAG: phosphoribosyltransferase [Pararhodobacter sp.]|nr:phosphoribosyltransferase [Pararhodobacter sp.]
MPGAERYPDRAAAGRALIAPLRALIDSQKAAPVLLALPRGGVPVAVEAARALGLNLGLAMVRKIGLPGQRELAVGAIAGPTGAELEINDSVARAFGLSRAEIEALAAPARDEIARRRADWGAAADPPDLAGRLAVLIDDGLATGATMRAAIAWARAAGAAQVAVAVPVGAPETVAEMERRADSVICPLTPQPFMAVGAHYARFDQVEEAGMLAMLADLVKEGGAPG